MERHHGQNLRLMLTIQRGLSAGGGGFTALRVSHLTCELARGRVLRHDFRVWDGGVMVVAHALALAGLILAPVTPVEQDGPIGPGGPVSLTGVGKWTVNFPESICAAERDFGLADAPTILALRPMPLNRNIEVRISEIDPAYITRTDKGSVTLQPSGRSFPTQIKSFGPVTNGRRLTTFFLEDVELNDIVMADAIVLDRGRAGTALKIVPAGTGELIESMERCSDGLLRDLGMDAAAMRRLSRQPMPVGGSERGWFKPRDYPKTAKKNFRSGRTTALLGIDANGKVARCNIAASAGNPDLDSRTCTVLTERGHYEPGLDAAGKAVASQRLVNVMWMPWMIFIR